MVSSKLLGVLVCLLAGIAVGQTVTANITGTVTDPSGAVVPNVKVAATNVGTNVQYAALTNGAGVYNLLFLPVGQYNVSTEAQGFKKMTLGPFTLEVNQIARVDVNLEVGETTQSVEIKDIAPILQTESTQTGDTLSSTKLTLPLNGRNFASLTMLIPGAISTSPNAMNTSGRFQGRGSRPQVNGNREQTNNFLLDGVDVNDSIDNRIGYQPNVDALEEVKVITGNGGAEFGNVGGAIVNVTLKSGTNEFHGNVFEFLRNDKLDANGFFRNRNRVTEARLPAGTSSAAHSAARSCKNKAFFFIDYEGTEQRDVRPGHRQRRAGGVAQRRSLGLSHQIQPDRKRPADGPDVTPVSPSRTTSDSRWRASSTRWHSTCSRNPDFVSAAKQCRARARWGLPATTSRATASKLVQPSGAMPRCDFRPTDKDNLTGSLVHRPVRDLRQPARLFPSR